MAEELTPLRRRPTLNDGQGPVQLQKADHNRDYGIVPSHNGGTGDALLRGLQDLNPKLGAFAGQQMQHAADDAALAGHIAGQRMDIAGVPASALAPAIAEATPPTAFGSTHAHAMTVAVAERYAIQAKHDMTEVYNDKKLTEGFNVEDFVKQHVDEQFKGTSDPSVLAALGRMQMETLSEFRNDQEKIRQGRLTESANASLSAFVDNEISGPITAEQAYKRYNEKIVPFGLSMGRHTRKELGQFMVGSIANLSNKLGGMPELFAALTEHRDAQGKSILDWNPELKAEVLKAKEGAIALREARLDKSTEDTRFANMRLYEGRLNTNPLSIKDEEVWNDDTSFKTTDAKLEFLKRRDHMAQTLAANALPFKDAENGTLGIGHSKEVQGKVMDKITAEPVALLRQTIAAANKGADTKAVGEAATALATHIVQAHSTAGTVVAAPAVVGILEAATKAPADPKKPLTPLLIAAAEVYRGLSPEQREQYAPLEDTKRVLDAFIDSRATLGDADAAAQAYRLTTPEHKAMVKEVRESAGFADKVSDAYNQVGGSNSAWYLPRFIEKWAGMVPSNEGQINAWARAETIRQLDRNPLQSADQAAEAALKAVHSRWVFDKASGFAYPAPQNTDADQFAKTVSFYLEPMAADLKLKTLPGNYKLALQPINSEKGEYAVWKVKDGAYVAMVKTVNAGEIMQNYQAKTQFTPEDEKALSDLRTSAKVTPEQVAAAAPALAKARQYGRLNGTELARYEALAGQTHAERIPGIPGLSLGTPDPSNLVDQRTTIKTPANETAAASQQWMTRAAGMSHIGFAGALVTAGESFELTAYDDPARGAGKNISTGYNFKANAQHIESDFTAAKIPREQWDAVKAGTVSISREQAMRITEVALKRYDKIARDVVDGVDPALWSRMTATQKAVVVDMAWQLGQTNLSKFKNAFASLRAGDVGAFANEMTVKYTRHDGTVVEDTRRNNLRAYMLAGKFSAVLDNNMKVPGSRLDFQKLTQK